MSNPQILHLIFSASIIAHHTKKEHNNVTSSRPNTDPTITDRVITKLDIIIVLPSGIADNL
jgi:hypothetical protein